MFVLREVFRDGQNEKQKTDVLQHDWSAKIDRLLGEPHYPSLTRPEIVDYVASLGLKRFDTRVHLCNCARTSGSTTEKEIAETAEHLAKVKGHPLYEELKTEWEAMVDRLRTVGVTCQASLDVVGVK
jgi:hypothetical protein